MAAGITCLTPLLLLRVMQGLEVVWHNEVSDWLLLRLEDEIPQGACCLPKQHACLAVLAGISLWVNGFPAFVLLAPCLRSMRATAVERQRMQHGCPQRPRPACKAALGRADPPEGAGRPAALSVPPGSCRSSSLPLPSLLAVLLWLEIEPFQCYYYTPLQASNPSLCADYSPYFLGWNASTGAKPEHGEVGDHAQHAQHAWHAQHVQRVWRWGLCGDGRAGLSQGGGL